MEFDFDLGQGIDGLVVKVGRLIAPFADGRGYVGKKRRGPVERLNVRHVAAPIDGDQYGNRTVRSGLLRELGIDSRCELAEDYFLLSAPQPPFARDAITRYSNRPLHVHGERAGSKYPLTGEVYIRGGHTSP